MSTNHELAALFALMADIMDIKGENMFKVLAFRKVGRILDETSADIPDLVNRGKVSEMEGIGAHSQRIIEEYVKTGQSADADALRASIPAGLLPLLKLEGMGPKTVSLLWKQRNIASAEDLAQAIADGSLAGIKGIGEKKIEGMKRALEAVAKTAGRIGIGEALPVAQMLLAQLRQVPGVQQAEIAGSLRRRRETIGDVDLLGAVEDGADASAITAAFAKFPGVDRALTIGAVKASVVTDSGVQVDLRLLPAANFGAGLLYFTGSKDHNVAIRTLAQKKGMTLNEWGLYKLSEYEKAEKKTGEAPAAKPVASKTEIEIYAKLGMKYVPPEMREDRGEVEAAVDKKVPKLIEPADIRGDLHTHTTASDGVDSIERMAEYAQEMGYAYLAITDHSKSQAVANGLDAARLLKHAEAIRKVAGRMKGFTLLAGSEVDILADGHLDYEDAVLAELDFVIASPHFSLKQEEGKATDRLLKAIENRYVSLIGHPTGRLILGREGLPLDFARIFKAAAETGTALEINAGYPRLDLNEVHSRAAVAAGVKLCINTDAHKAEAMREIGYGLGVARRAWVTAREVINCWPAGELKKFIAKKRGMVAP